MDEVGKEKRRTKTSLCLFVFVKGKCPTYDDASRTGFHDSTLHVHTSCNLISTSSHQVQVEVSATWRRSTTAYSGGVCAILRGSGSDSLYSVLGRTRDLNVVGGWRCPCTSTTSRRDALKRPLFKESCAPGRSCSCLVPFPAGELGGETESSR